MAVPLAQAEVLGERLEMRPGHLQHSGACRRAHRDRDRRDAPPHLAVDRQRPLVQQFSEKPRQPAQPRLAADGIPRRRVDLVGRIGGDAGPEALGDQIGHG